jgi:hypothetical protein
MVDHKLHQGLIMHMKHLMGGSALVLALLQSIAPAYGQEFFIRERLKGLPAAVVETPTPVPTPTPTPTPTPEPTYTYTPTYNTVWSKCSGGSQSATIKTCTRSDGKVVANSMCGPEAQTTTQQCASVTCASWQVGMSNTSANVLLGKGSTDPALTDPAAQLALCENYAETNNVGGVCIAEVSGPMSVRFVAGKYNVAARQAWRAAICTKD